MQKQKWFSAKIVIFGFQKASAFLFFRRASGLNWTAPDRFGEFGSPVSHGFHYSQVSLSAGISGIAPLWIRKAVLYCNEEWHQCRLELQI